MTSYSLECHREPGQRRVKVYGNDSSKMTKKSTALLLQDAERNAAYFNKFKARILHVHWSRFRKDLAV